MRQDPNELLHKVRNHITRARGQASPEMAEYEFTHAADAFAQLDTLLSEGGELPQAWQPGDRS